MLTTLADAPAGSDQWVDPRDDVPVVAPPSARLSDRPLGACLPWPGKGRPSTAVEERRFVERLTDRADSSSPCSFDPDSTEWSRRDVTAVVTALRCGLDADELLRRAPGLVPGRLVAAHRAVEIRRREAERAWGAIVADPTSDRLLAHRDTVEAVLPVVVARLDDQTRHGAAHLEAAVDAAAAQIERLGQVAQALEEWLANSSCDQEPHTGGLLYDLDRPGLWDHDHFLPPRVGTLVPSRLAALLGERATSRH